MTILGVQRPEHKDAELRGILRRVVVVVVVSVQGEISTLLDRMLVLIGS
jgi:hypothetical protein